MTELDDIFSSLTRPEKRKHTNDEAPVKSTQGTRGRKREKKAKGAGEAGGALPAKAGGESKADTPAPPRASALAKKDSTSAKKTHEKPVPEVVHDTSATPKPAARAPQPPLDDDDAAFADSRGTERTCAMYTDAGKRTEEGYRVFNEDELKLGQGGGTQAPELRKAIGDKLLTPVWMPRRTEIIESQERHYEDMLALDPSPSTATLQFVRSGLQGAVVGYREVVSSSSLQALDDSSGPNLSVQRPISTTHSFVRGSTAQAPFQPGGLDDTVTNVAPASSNASWLSGGQLRTVPPGFAHGLPSDGAAVDSSLPAWRNTLSQVAPSLLDRTVITAAEDGLYKLSDKAPTAQNQDAVVDELLPEETLPRMFHGVAPRASEERREWAHVIDASKQMTNFDELVPYMAHKFPFELDTFQKQAVYHLEQNDSVFVAAHTSAGKTVVAEYAIALAQKHMTRCIYTSPIKALSNQKFREFKFTFGAENVGILTGDVQINPEAPCLIMTTEILRSMLYRGADLIRDVEFVIFDEVHYVNDMERGVVWEEVIILLPSHINIVLLSATVPNTKGAWQLDAADAEFADWVGRTKKKDVYVISTSKRPVPLEHFIYAGKELHRVVDAKSRFLASGVHAANDALKSKQEREGTAPVRGARGGARGAQRGGARGGGGRVAPRGGRGGGAMSGRRGDDRSLWVHLVGLLKKKSLLPVVVFVFSKRRCEEYANSLPNTDLCTAKEKSEVHISIERSLTRLKDVDRDLPQIHRMRELLSRGIGVHHSGLLPIMKEMVEILFQRGLVKVLFATETFAMGVNMPARSVVFSGLRKNDGQSFRSLLPGEYTQMSGRAGRRGLDATGVVIIVGNDETPDVHGLNRMILGQSTKLKSQFRITYGMVLNLLRVEALKVEEMIKRSFSENATQRMLPEQQRMLRELQNKNAALEPEFRTCALPVDELSALYDCSRKTLSCSNALHAMAFHHSQGNRCFGEGRVVLLREGLGDVVPAIIVRPVTGEHFLVLAAPTVAQKQARSSARLLPMWVTPALAAQLAEPRVPNLREVPLSDILLVTAFTVSISVAAIQSRRQSVLRKALDALSPCMEAIRAHVAAAGARTAVVIAELEVDWSRLRRLDFLEMRKERDALLGELVERQLLMEHEDFVREYVLMHRRKELEKQMAHVSAKLSNENLDLLPDYHQRVDVLKTLRFIDPESETVLLKGRVACEIRSCNELILTELILDNTFTEYAPEEIAALLSVFHFREKSAEPELNDTLQSGYRRIIEAADRVAAVQLSHQLPTEDDASTLKTGLVEVVYEWACGKTFNEIMQLTDVGEGTIVRCIMRLDETFREIREASRIIGDMDLLRKMETCQLLVRRDIVFAASLYF